MVYQCVLTTTTLYYFVVDTTNFEHAFWVIIRLHTYTYSTRSVNHSAMIIASIHQSQGRVKLRNVCVQAVLPTLLWIPNRSTGFETVRV
eukprot:1701828-Pyramimonas_sp.AAC.1